VIPAPPTASDITLAILAGGEGARMGQPKGLLRIDDKPILEYLLDRFDWPGPTMLVTAPGREHPPGSKRFGMEAIDPVAGQGPLRGVLTAIERATTDWVALVTVDMPGVGREQVEALVARVPPIHIAAMFRRRSGHEGAAPIVEPFPLLIRREAATVVRSRIARDLLSVARLLDDPAFIAVDAPGAWEPLIWTNLNRPEDLNLFRPPP
jgi:molybdenum cofactor guanylyltransferase